MDKSYRLKMEDRLNKNILTTEYIINCVAKDESKINELAYKEKQYRCASHGTTEDYKERLNKRIEYRKPFIDVLMYECRMSLDDIKNLLSNVKEKNIPTKDTCDRIRYMIVSGNYKIID